MLLLCQPLKEATTNKWLKTLGDMSYSIYMTHYYIIGIACRVLIDTTNLNILNTVVVIAAIAGTVLCSGVVYWLFEKRLAEYLNRLINKKTRCQLNT